MVGYGRYKKIGLIVGDGDKTLGLWLVGWSGGDGGSLVEVVAKKI